MAEGTEPERGEVPEGEDMEAEEAAVRVREMEAEDAETPKPAERVEVPESGVEAERVERVGIPVVPRQEALRAVMEVRREQFQD